MCVLVCACVRVYLCVCEFLYILGPIFFYLDGRGRMMMDINIYHWQRALDWGKKTHFDCLAEAFHDAVLS